MELRVRRLRTDGRDFQCSLERVMLIRKPLQAKMGAVHYDDYSDHDGALFLMDMVSGTPSILFVPGHTRPCHATTQTNTIYSRQRRGRENDFWCQPNQSVPYPSSSSPLSNTTQTLH